MVGTYEWELRERLAAVLEKTAALDDGALAADAAQLLADYRQVWTRDWRWRNRGEKQPAVLHVAGPVIASREYRRSCPTYIVDQRQACDRCGEELVRGRWAMFWEIGAVVAKYGTVTFLPRGERQGVGTPPEIDCIPGRTP